MSNNEINSNNEKNSSQNEQNSLQSEQSLTQDVSSEKTYGSLSAQIPSISSLKENNLISKSSTDRLLDNMSVGSLTPDIIPLNKITIENALDSASNILNNTKPEIIKPDVLNKTNSEILKPDIIKKPISNILNSANIINSNTANSTISKSEPAKSENPIITTEPVKPNTTDDSLPPLPEPKVSNFKCNWYKCCRNSNPKNWKWSNLDVRKWNWKKIGQQLKCANFLKNLQAVAKYITGCFALTGLSCWNIMQDLYTLVGLLGGLKKHLAVCYICMQKIPSIVLTKLFILLCIIVFILCIIFVYVFGVPGIITYYITLAFIRAGYEMMDKSWKVSTIMSIITLWWVSIIPCFIVFVSGIYLDCKICKRLIKKRFFCKQFMRLVYIYRNCCRKPEECPYHDGHQHESQNELIQISDVIVETIAMH